MMIVDDHADTRELFAASLSSYGYRVVSASLGTEALRMASDVRPDVVVLDAALGGLLTGHDVCRTMRAEPALADTRILMVSGYTRDEDQALARDAGCDAFLPKPCTPDTLLSAIASLLDSGPGSDPVEAVRPRRSSGPRSF